MSLSFKIFRGSSTNLYINGPRLEFKTQPSDATIDNGDNVTFTSQVYPYFGEPGVSTGFGVASGSTTYRWYKDDLLLIDGGRISGAGTSMLTITGAVSADDSGSYKVRTDYIPSTYHLERRYKTAGRATNAPLDSNSVNLKVYPTVTITTQPTSQTVADGEEATFTADASVSNSDYTLNYFWTLDGTEIASSNSKTLTITKSGTGTQKVQFNAFVTRDDSTRITATSNEVDFIGVSPRSVLRFEAYKSDNTYSTSTQNLDDGDFTLNSSTFGSGFNIIQFNATEKSFDLKMEIKASRGANNGSIIGGEGGTSNVTLTLAEDTEYTILGVGNNSSVFIYQGSQLLLVVGQGGDAGTVNQGGAGGGANRAGTQGSGSAANRGQGGPLIASGNLTLNGSFGSILSSVTLESGDSLESTPNGGQTISCTKGSHWIDQGIAACSNNSSSAIKYRNTDGTEIANSDTIIRGFKPGYTITSTAGRGQNNGGNGGDGATGGDGGNNGAGGGGGSGYTNGTATIDSSTSGGNSTNLSTIRFFL